jgi:polyhydroxyalkanoate synthesis repressor PhaR
VVDPVTRRTNAKTSRPAPAKEPPPKRRRGRPPKRETQTPNVPGARIIKKYGNRRLYDHTLSRAVTMEELAAAVKKGEDIRVLDGDTGEDLTKRILVQIILEESNRHQLELLPIEFLRQVIQLRSEPLSQWISQYLAAGAEWLGRQMNSVAGNSAGNAALRNLQQSLEGLFPWMRKDGPSAPSPSSGGPAPDPDRDIADSLDDLHQRLAELTKLVTRR